MPVWGRARAKCKQLKARVTTPSLGRHGDRSVGTSVWARARVRTGAAAGRASGALRGTIRTRRKALVTILAILVKARTYGAINGIASGSSSSATPLAYPTLFSTFFSPTGHSGMSASHSFLVSATHVPGQPNSIADALSSLLVTRCRTLLPSPWLLQ